MLHIVRVLKKDYFKISQLKARNLAQEVKSLIFI
jgi:hypothetical protein